MTDNFFTQPDCDRCSKPLKPARTMSWFNKDVICTECKDEETELKKQLRATGVNPQMLEGCGYIPTPKPIQPENFIG